MNEQEIFHQALSLPPAARPAFLDHACAGDAAVRASVEALLRANEGASGFLDAPAFGAGFVRDVAAIDARIGGYIGPYRLKDQIGEGGMGTVYLADQSHPVRRQVALKVVKPGMDSRRVVARFEAERQALALMDHPNIARVLDAGATDLGRPYFVMEYVPGVPITRYCDEARLTVEERLRLFIPVCEAIQHAHQKGIIHRDVKPTNVIVTLYDGKPVPKVIDFGIAKAVEQELADPSLGTQFGQVVGTLEYMAPEQAEPSSKGVDTRADVYSLGVLLYELLVGSTPHSSDRLEQRTYAELVRVITELDPPTPSTRLGDSGERTASISAVRRTEPKKLAKLVRGELDWIVMRCLEKDRDRRYASANEIAADLLRHLNDEPVHAGPPSAVYRLREFARRNRGPMIAASLVLLSLVAGVVGTTWGMVEAKAAGKRESERADGEKKANEQSKKRLAQIEKGNEILAAIFRDLNITEIRQGTDPLEAVLAKRLVKAGEQLEGEAVGDPLAVASLQNDLGVSLFSLGFQNDAIAPLEKAVSARKLGLGPDHPDTLASTSRLAEVLSHLGQDVRAIRLAEETLKRQTAILGPDHPDRLATMNTLAQVFHWNNQAERALPLREEVLKLKKSKFGRDHPNTLLSMFRLATDLQRLRHYDQAYQLLEETLKLQKATVGPDHPNTLESMNELAFVLQATGQLDRAIPLYEETLKLKKARLGFDHPDTVITQYCLAGALLDAGESDRALPITEEATKLSTAKRGALHPFTFHCVHRLAENLCDVGRVDEGLQLHQESLARLRTKYGPEHGLTLGFASTFGARLRKAGRLDRSIKLIEELIPLWETSFGRRHTGTTSAIVELGIDYIYAGRYADALRLLEEAHAARNDLHYPVWASVVLLDAQIKARKLPEAMKLAAELMTAARKKPANPGLFWVWILLRFGYSLCELKSFPDAESVLRDALVIQEKQTRDAWWTFAARAILGAALLGQNKFADAEPLLLTAYEGMKKREKNIPPDSKIYIHQTIDGLIELYTATNKPDEARKWRAERAKYYQPGSPTPAKK
jgi:serine/threonine protein kinase/tetratricopeptide (TPR) repeat protein